MQTQDINAYLKAPLSELYVTLPDPAPAYPVLTTIPNLPDSYRELEIIIRPASWHYTDKNDLWRGDQHGFEIEATFFFELEERKLKYRMRGAEGGYIDNGIAQWNDKHPYWQLYQSDPKHGTDFYIEVYDHANILDKPLSKIRSTFRRLLRLELERQRETVERAWQLRDAIVRYGHLQRFNQELTDLVLRRKQYDERQKR